MNLTLCLTQSFYHHARQGCLKFLSTLVVIALFHPATGLQCFSHQTAALCDDTFEGRVVECHGANTGCSIAESYVYMGIVDEFQ